jgi:ABC-type transport system involved in multi-copper enzyme maturation permease subunit
MIFIQQWEDNMRVFSTLIKRELFEHLTSSRYVVTSILCAVLCVTSIVLMSHDYANRRKRFDLSHNVSGLRQMPRDRKIIAKPPQPLSIIAKGVEEVIGRSLLISEGQHEEEPIAQVFNYYGEEHHLFDLFTTPDFVYVISVVLSALAIFISFDAICGEKETHTLSLLLSNSLRRSTLLFAKWIGGYTTLLISLLPAIILMLIFIQAFPSVPLQTEHWIRLAIIIGLSFVYLSVFFTLGLLISTLTHRSATALILVLFIWVIWALGAPRIGTLAARAIKPVQPVFAFWMAKREARQGKWEQDRENLWKMDDAYIATVDGQIEIGQHLSRLSPLSSYIYASTTLTQTGIPDMKDYRLKVSQWDRERKRRREDSNEFAYQTLTIQQSFSDIFIDVALLMLWNVLLFMCANMVFLPWERR